MLFVGSFFFFAGVISFFFIFLSYFLSLFLAFFPVLNSYSSVPEKARLVGQEDFADGSGGFVLQAHFD
jgi:hypothetical protein